MSTNSTPLTTRPASTSRHEMMRLKFTRPPYRPGWARSRSAVQDHMRVRHGETALVERLADDHALQRGAGRESLLHRIQRAQAAAVLHRHAELLHDPAELVEVGGRPRPGSVQVHDVQVACARLRPRAGGGQRVLVIDGLRGEVPPYEPH